MARLVEWVAPRGLGDATLKSAAFLALINLLNYALITARGSAYGLVDDLLNTTLVALPFVAVIMATLTHQRRLQGRLATLATTDVLTGLPNRRAFLARTAEAAGQPGALLLLDADHFKRINDAFGHAAGDACLAAIGDRLRRAAGPTAIVGRLGGEEFGLFLPGAGREEAVALGARLCRAIAVEAEGVEAELRVTLSVGAALGGPAGSQAPIERLMARADHALYRAKAEGRARVVVWSEGDRATGAGDLAA